jgi:nucleotide-binding universal stress UspA family protein
MTGYDTILVAVDGSACATAAAEHALELAAEYDAALHVVYVIDATDLGLTTPSEIDVEQVKASLRTRGEEATDAVVQAAADAGVDAVAEVRVGIPHEAIREYAAEIGADLLAVGTHGRTGVERYLLGSVAERVVRTADVPVLTVHVEA